MNGTQLPATPANTMIQTNDPEYASEFALHVKTGDYFAMIATLLGFVEEVAEKLEEKDGSMKIANAEIKKLKQNLMYLQKNYSIQPKGAELVS